MTHAPAPEFLRYANKAAHKGAVPIAKQDVAAWTALRAFACLWVVVFHFDVRFSTSLGGALVDKGYLAVDLFFVLSGAVIFHVYGASIRDQTFSWKSFLWKRFARLYPVHFVTLALAVALIYGSALFGFGRAPGYDPVTAIVANLFAIHGLGVLDELTLNYPSWSISAEFAAYAVFPVLAYIALTCSRGMLLALGALVYIGMVLVIQPTPDHVFAANEGGQKLTSLTYNMSFLRIWPAFFLGIAVCRLLDGRGAPSRYTARSALLGICALMVLCLLTGQDWAFVLAGAALVGLLLVGGFQPPQWVIFLGTISYSIYMVHALVAMVAFKGIEVIGGYGDNAVSLVWWPFVIAATIGAGYLLWRFVEEPMRRLLTGARMAAPPRSRDYAASGHALRNSR